MQSLHNVDTVFCVSTVMFSPPLNECLQNDLFVLYHNKQSLDLSKMYRASWEIFTKISLFNVMNSNL